MDKRLIFFGGLFLIYAAFQVSPAPFKRVDFSGYKWQIKESDAKTGPGPNRFSSESVDLDPINDQLKLSINKMSGKWYSGEIISDENFGYGEFTIDLSLPETWDSQLVFGFFLYNEKKQPFYNEIDFEVSRWGMSQGDIFHFSVQPYSSEGNTHSFIPEGISERYTARINWMPDKISFSIEDISMNIIESWTYQGVNIPQNTKSKLHMNLWLFQGKSPANDGEMFVTIHNFSYSPFF